MTNQKPLLKALRGESATAPPVWIMRQAGRYLPEYRAIRSRAGDFLSLCYTPELAAEASLQPVRRFGFDATILFSDILLVAQALGSDLEFSDGRGPCLSRISTPSDVDGLRSADSVPSCLQPIYETLRILLRDQPANATLIGFAGSPWTVATYMISGGNMRGQEPAVKFLDHQRTAFHRLIDRLVDATIIHLSEQIKSGAEVVKLFDTWAGRLNGADFDDFVVQPNNRIIDAVKSEFPEVPIILFPRHAGRRYADFAAANVVDCLAIDQTVDPDWAAKRLQPTTCVQGNLDPSLLVSGGQPLVDATLQLVNSLSGGPHVFNLGHGITPDARIENVELMVTTVRSS
ncbi:MAG: uroporphyrinogen decarboxylase [Rhodobacteraceae bacterium]|nr:uroporphyrinogen decarboxylase [Paracoccaceae bacterium]